MSLIKTVDVTKLNTSISLWDQTSRPSWNIRKDNSISLINTSREDCKTWRILWEYFWVKAAAWYGKTGS